MTKSITLGLCLIVMSIASPAVGQYPNGTERLLLVRGHLDAHWEYPNFIPDKSSGLTVIDFQIREEKWQEIFFAPVRETMISGSAETICFRVIGQGFLAPRQPSSMQPWEGSQFIFVKIKKLERIKSYKKCDPHPKTNVS
ncbi:MAG: hypothetical protein V4523_06155 [Pseudomonadota bacterium]